MAQVERATALDAAVVGGLLHEFNTEFDSPTPTAAQFARRFEQLLAQPEVLVLLARDGAGAVTGFAFLTLRPTPYADGPLSQLEELYVRPPLRDKGIGTALMGRAFAEVTALGSQEMRIDVDEDDIDTRRFYERHGFATIRPGTDFRALCYLRDL